MVQQLLYAKHDITPEFVTSGESNGYIWGCNNLKEDFSEREELRVSLTLFGKAVFHVNMYINALLQLGKVGLGLSKAKFSLRLVCDSEKRVLFDGNSRLFESGVDCLTLNEYVDLRMRELTVGRRAVLQLQSPITLKHNGRYMAALDADVFYRALTRRIYMLNCFEGKQTDIYEPNQLAPFCISRLNCRMTSVPRFSARKKQHMKLWGVLGEADLCWEENEVTQEFVRMLIAGEVTHVGKNTSFGFGEYRLLFHQ